MASLLLRPLALLAASAFAVGALAADLKVGVISSLSGPVAGQGSIHRLAK